MSDNGEEEDEPVVELGDGDDVEGAPVSRVASRLFFPIERSEIVRREGDATVRTPDGPRTVEEVLDGTDAVYFETSQDLVRTVRSVVGTGPVPTAGGGSESSGGAAGGDAGDEAAAAEDAAGGAADEEAEPGAEAADEEDGAAAAEDSEFEFDDEE